jgi:hypothetical protein
MVVQERGRERQRLLLQHLRMVKHLQRLSLQLSRERRGMQGGLVGRVMVMVRDQLEVKLWVRVKQIQQLLLLSRRQYLLRREQQMTAQAKACMLSQGLLLSRQNQQQRRSWLQRVLQRVQGVRRWREQQGRALLVMLVVQRMSHLQQLLRYKQRQKERHQHLRSPPLSHSRRRPVQVVRPRKQMVAMQA